MSYEKGYIVFMGYRLLRDGSKGPAELNRLVRSVGDAIIVVNGNNVVGKTFKQAALCIKKCHKFAYVRFRELK